MLVRVFDSQSNTYFKSHVYAIINTGWYQKRLVIVPSDNGNYFKLFDEHDKNRPVANVLINTISSDDFCSDFEAIALATGDENRYNVNEKLGDYTDLPESIHFYRYYGYSWIYRNKPLLTKLLKGGMVSIKGYEEQLVNSSVNRLEDWNYVENQADIDFLLQQTASFHDSVLKELKYISGSYVDAENHMRCTDNVRQVTMFFDSQWCSSIEMIFESVIGLNLRPHQDNHFSVIFEASLFIQDETVFFFDSQLNSIDRSYNGTWIEAYRLRWRLCE